MFKRYRCRLSDSSVIATTCFAISSLLLLIANWWQVKVITRHNLACDYKQYKIQIPDYLSSIIGCVWKRVSWEFPWKYLVANIADVFLTAILCNVPRLVALVTPASTYIQRPLVLTMCFKHYYPRNKSVERLDLFSSSRHSLAKCPYLGKKYTINTSLNHYFSILPVSL